MKRFFSTLFGITILIFIGIFLFFFFPNIRQDRVLYISSESSYQNVLDSLQNQKTLRSVFLFKISSKITHYDKKIKSGRYKLKQGFSTKKVLKKLISGNQDPVKLRIKNHRKLESLVGDISRQMEIDSASFLRRLQDSLFLSVYPLENRTFSPENVILCFVPNTYFVYWDLSENAFFERMYQECKAFWNPERLNALFLCVLC